MNISKAVKLNVRTNIERVKELKKTKLKVRKRERAKVKKGILVYKYKKI